MRPSCLKQFAVLALGVLAAGTVIGEDTPVGKTVRVQGVAPICTEGATREFVGQIVSVSPFNHTMSVQGTVARRLFWVAENCAIVLADQPGATLSNVRAGMQVHIKFFTQPDNTDVMCAITQVPLTTPKLGLRSATTAVRCGGNSSAGFTGTLMAVSPLKRTLTVRHRAASRSNAYGELDTAQMTFQVAEDCKISTLQKVEADLTELKLNAMLEILYMVPRHDSPVACTIRALPEISPDFKSTPPTR